MPSDMDGLLMAMTAAEVSNAMRRLDPAERLTLLMMITVAEIAVTNPDPAGLERCLGVFANQARSYFPQCLKTLDQVKTFAAKMAAAESAGETKQ